MLKICPVSNETINETAARTTALLVAATLLILLLASANWLIGLLALDFFLRGFGARRFSPYAQLSKALVAALQAPSRPTNLAPKQFAARIGFILSALSGLFFLVDWPVLGLATALVIAVFALLEGLAGICVACMIYPYALHWQGDTPA